MTIAELAQYYDRETLALQIRYCKVAGRHKDLARLLEAQRLQTTLIIGESEGNEALRRSPQYAEAYEKYCWFRLMLDPPSPRQSKPRKQVQASPRAARPMRRVGKIMASLARKIAAQTNVNEPGPDLSAEALAKAEGPGVSDATPSNANKPGPKGPGVLDATRSSEIQKTPAVHDDGESNIHELRIVKSRDDVGTHVDRRTPARALRLALMSHIALRDRDGGTHPVLSDRAYGGRRAPAMTGSGGACLRAA
jgi:hypothetical protein